MYMFELLHVYRHCWIQFHHISGVIPSLRLHCNTNNSAQLYLRTVFGAKAKGSLYILFAPFHLSSASFNATFMADSIFAPAADSSEGMGTPKNKGDCKVEEDIDTQQNARREAQGGGSLDQLRCFHR